MKKIFVVFAWSLLSVGVLLTSAATLIVYNQYQQKVTQDNSILPSSNSDSQIAILDNNGEVKGVEAVIETQDAREIIVANFLERHNSPMKPYEFYGARLVEIADKNGLDFRLMPAISMQESNLCKNTNPGAPHNCLGFGIHKRGTLDFDTYEAGFERAAREIKERYVDIGLETPEQIMRKYTPSSNGSWAESVKQWMAEMRYDDRDKGRTLKTNDNVLELARPSTPAAEITQE
ncbi:MAG: hypothetical protein OEX81_02215 [Candidatus Pacebacteria bacterium]|nr:hypothetical protein [Candidatus Paceibacterota bacterium]